MDYKIAIYKDKFYKEIKLSQNWQNGLLVGTTKECQMRFYKEELAQDFIMRIQSVNGQWTAACSDAIYFQKQGEDSQTNVQYLMPMDKLVVCNATTHAELFYMEFFIDFVEKTTDYDRLIQCDGQTDITIGGMQGCTIRVMDPVLANDSVRLRKTADGWLIDSSGAKYGIQKNGFPVRGMETRLCDRDIFSINGVSFFWREECLYTASEIELMTPLTTRLIQQQKNHLQYPKFVRSARQQFVIPSEKIDILPPKTKPEEPKKNLVMTMVPLLVSMGMMVMLRMAMGGNKMFALMCVGMGSVSIIMSIINYKNEGVLYRKNMVKRENDYNRYIAGQEKKIQELHEKERIISRQKYPSVEEQLTYVEDFDARLFEKQKTHEDYLYVRLGEGTIPSNCEITYKAQEYREVEDPMMDYPEKIHHKYQYISDMPVMLNLTDTNAVGFIGDRNHLYQMMKNLILEICIEHYYQDVKLFLLMGKEDKQYFSWARWFRNTNEDGGMRNFMYDEESSKMILEYLYAQLSEREKLNRESIEALPTYIVFVYRSGLLGEHPVSNYLEKAASLGFVFLFFEEYTERINPYCSKRVFLHNDSYTGYVQDIEDGEQIQSFSYQRIPVEKASAAALKMACVYVDEVSLESNLTKNITLYQLLDIRNVYELDLAKRWSHSKIYESMAAPLGVKSGDEIVYLDLHEKFHGPHGLVAGTTGSGKSEILQTYILSMATLFHPYEVGFIIIDFKGGGMVNQFRNLPHLNGAITNIDGKEINRSLLSIRAELRRRQELFAKYGVNHIDDYMKLFKRGETSQPLPHLILIVDEFAELKSEQPEFMKELISAARIGRSLGVHLILATQKPSGVVNEQIWSNSKFKLCLKVQTKEDSNEVLKSPLASEIREPGRAYLQVGNNEIFQLFQSAYSGAPAQISSLGEQRKFSISKVSLSGQREIIFEQKQKVVEASETQLQAIVNYIDNYCKESNLERLPNIFLPPLVEKIAYTTDGYSYNTSDIVIPVGVYDDPARQSQKIADINLTQSHLFVLGSSQMGKTSMLQMIIKGVALRYSPEEVNIYILDFASMILKNFEGLCHVGGVITARDDEKLKNFIKLINQMIAERKEIFAKLGLSSFSAYREAGYKDLQQIIIILDNVTAFKELYPAYEEMLSVFCRDGISIGITIVATNMQTTGMGFRFLSNFNTRISFTCNNTSEYGALFDKCRMTPKEIPGRALIQIEKEVYECQMYIAFDAEKEIERTQQMKAFIEERNNYYGRTDLVKYIPVIPDIVSKQYLNAQLHRENEPYEIPIGLDFSNIEPVLLALSKVVQFGIVGHPGYGKSNFIQYMLSVFEERKEQEPIEIYISDNVDKKLMKYQESGIVQQYSYNPADSLEMVKSIFEKLEKRYQLLIEGKDTEVNEEPFEILILNAKEAYSLISMDRGVVDMYKKIITQFKAMKVCIILSDMENAAIGFNSCEVLKQLKETKTVLIFENLAEQKVIDVSTADLRENKKKIKAGEAYWFERGTFCKIKTPLYNTTDEN